jgi:polar amino acid transport system substrate-binding protein
MDKKISRRIVLAGLSLPFVIRPSFAQTAVTLDQLKSTGSMRVGLVNEPPYSSLNPDGTIGGFVPTLVQQIMEKLGVPKLEPYVATYGELIPGLQAGRWEMIAAAFRITKARCAQVAFTDPVTFDGGAITYVAANMQNAPKSMKDLASGDAMIGALQGTYLLKIATDQGIPESRISQFPNNSAMIDGLLAGRIAVALFTNASARELQKQRGGFEIVYPLQEDPPVGSAPAFAMGDTALHDAFQTELRAMHKSGELVAMAQKFGFEPPPANLESVTAEQVCAAS